MHINIHIYVYKYIHTHRHIHYCVKFSGNIKTIPWDFISKLGGKIGEVLLMFEFSKGSGRAQEG